MEPETYRQIRESVHDIGDIEPLALRFKQPRGVIGAILNQKVVNYVKKNHYLLERQKKENVRLWKTGSSILEIARHREFPPTLVISGILQEMGYSKKYTINHLEELSDRRLAAEIEAALESDPYFSPWAHSMQASRGAMGEEILAEWLKMRDVPYRTEQELREKGCTKTPDFLLDGPFLFGGKSVNWVESKAVFGSHEEHENYLNRQFNEYRELYGTGLVVYWYGYLDDIVPENHLLRDYRLEGKLENDLSRKIIELLNFVPGVS